MFIYKFHTLSSLLNSELTQHFSASRLTSYEILLPSPPNLHLKHCNMFNPAVLLPLPFEGQPHDCEVIRSQSRTPRSDLQDTPLIDPDLILFMPQTKYMKNRIAKLIMLLPT